MANIISALNSKVDLLINDNKILKKDISILINENSNLRANVTKVLNNVDAKSLSELSLPVEDFKPSPNPNTKSNAVSLPVICNSDKVTYSSTASASAPNSGSPTNNKQIEPVLTATDIKENKIQISNTAQKGISLSDCEP